MTQAGVLNEYLGDGDKIEWPEKADFLAAN